MLNTNQNLNALHDMDYVQLARLYWLETKFEWLKTIRNPAFSLPALSFPVIFYLFFGVLFNHGNVQASSYLLCTYGVFGVMGPALFSFGAGLAIERGQGWLDIKEASPMPASAQLISRLVVAMLFSLIIVISLSVVAVTMAGVQLQLWQWLTLMAIWVLGGLPFCLLGLALGLVLKAQSAPAVVNLIYLPLAFLSGLWMPISMLPGFMQNFAQFLPPYHLAQLALKVVDLDAGQDSWQHILALLIYAVIFFVLSRLAFNKKAR
ncbi:ABC transporter permease [Paraglaciecola hydrolytica]|uniref:ABC transporter permease n=1 Tax=Paraglaciecola hydrolytica TaxID=1799789 RepID=A0A148KMK2_9ALTE|nr:ABC transporter permease [Paraglaciecola hydrolytica]KXI27554.1 ABC transporter permease [Paraglaciecola hydrolytica]